jgi:cytosine/uracil/thiamine/allantoin permease
MAASNAVARTLSLLATVVRVVCSIIGALIVIHAAFVLFGANSLNVLVQFTASIRDSFGWFTKNLFAPSDPKIAKLIVRFAPATKAKVKA